MMMFQDNNHPPEMVTDCCRYTYTKSPIFSTLLLRKMARRGAGEKSKNRAEEVEIANEREKEAFKLGTKALLTLITNENRNFAYQTN